MSSSAPLIDISREESGNEFIDDFGPSDPPNSGQHALPTEEISVVEKIFSKDKKEYISGDWKNGRLIRIHTGQFTFENDANGPVYTKVLGRVNLFTSEIDNFIARVEINKLEEVCFIDDSFTTVKRNLFRNLRIVKIVEDRKLEDRNAVYDMFRQCLRHRGRKTTDSLKCASDFLQLCTLLIDQKLKGMRPFTLTTSMLNHIQGNKFISTEVKDAAKRLLNAEIALHERNENFPAIDNTVQVYVGDLCQELHKIYDEGVNHHMKSLLNECPSYNSELPEMMTDLNKLSGQQALYLSKKDIQLFRSLVATTSQEEEAIDEQCEQLLRGFLKDLWRILYGRVVEKNEQSSSRQLVPLTNPAFVYLYKSFQELMMEISTSGIPVQNLLIRDGDEWTLEEFIVLPSTSRLSPTVLQQFRFIFKSMKHFQPGFDSCGEKFKYDCKVQHSSFDAAKSSSIPEERLIWLYVLDDSLARIQREASSGRSKEYLQSLIDILSTGYMNYIERNNDRYESLRIMVRNIISFVSFLSRMDLESSFDRSILGKQMKYITDMMVAEQDDDLSESFASLIDMFNEFWKHRESIIANISQKFPYKHFMSRMERISQQILRIVDISFTRKVKPDTLINFFRSFNEFLKQFESIKFEWLIKNDHVSDELITQELVKFVEGDTQSYKVLLEIVVQDFEEPLVRIVFTIFPLFLSTSNFDLHNCLDYSLSFLILNSYSFPFYNLDYSLSLLILNCPFIPTFFLFHHSLPFHYHVLIRPSKSRHTCHWSQSIMPYSPPFLRNHPGNNSLSTGSPQIHCPYTLIQKSLTVLKPNEFILKCNQNDTPVPRHYLIEILENLLKTVNERGQRTGEHDVDTSLNEISDLLIVIGNSFIHFKDQSTYVDFDVFLNDSTTPFSNVIRGNSSYREFKKRLDNIENFYLYTRKQNEIGIEKALDLYAFEAESIENSGFDGSFGRSIMAECYNRYLAEFNNYIEKASMQDIIYGLAVTQRRFKLENNLQIDKWTEKFKRETIPSLLAGLSAVWSIQRSKDVATTGRSLKPHCIQVLCILKLLNVDQQSNLQNHLAQVLTGQGKSIVLGLLSSLLALLGYRVRVVCYSKYLADRDQQDFNQFSQQLSELEIDSNVTYGTFDNMANEILNPKASGQKDSLCTLVEKMIVDKLEKQTDQPKSGITDCLNFFGLGKQDNTDLSKQGSTILLIDEVDVFFSHAFYGSTYNPVAVVKMPILADIQLKIWSIVADCSRMESVLKKVNDFIDTIVRDNRDQEFIKLLSSTGSFFREHLNEMISCAIKVKEGNDRDWYINRYEIDYDGIICYKDTNGLLRTSIYSSYYNVFNYFRLKKTDFDHRDYHNYGYLQVPCGNVAYAKLPNEYPVILGVSGTLTTLNDSEKEAIRSYNINKVSIMPSFFGRHKLKYDKHEHFVVEYSEEAWLNTIFSHATSLIQSGRAVLIYFDTEIEVNKFKAKSQSDINRLNVVTGNEEKSRLDRYINEAGVAETVTLAIRGMGRGIDFKSNDSSVEEKGGVHVIQTFFSLDEKEEIQIKGRTARKDNRGSYELILCGKHLINIDCLFHSSYENLSRARKILAEERGSKNAERIRKSEKIHNLTMKFLKSFSDYTPDKRSKYFLEYPFVKPNDM